MKHNRSKTVILITGPTAVGKTSLAFSLAQHFDTAILSADSRQCFREMNIGTAKPSAEELEKVTYYFVNSHSVTEEMNAAIYEKYALSSAEEVFKQKEMLILCGGTGLYIKAFCEGIDEIPPVSEEIRQQLIARYEESGLNWLQNELAEKDPDGYAQIDQKNPHRLLRALAVMKATGQSITVFQKKEAKPREFNVLPIGLELPKDELWRNIRHRTAQMIEKGLKEEVEQLLSYRHYKALQTVGYQELFAHLDGKCSLEEAVEAIIIHTRQYAKRQMTWFKKDPAVHWFDPSDRQDMLDFISKNIK